MSLEGDVRRCFPSTSGVGSRAVAPSLATVQHRLTHEMRTRCAQALRLAESRGQTVPELDVDTAAAAIVVTVDAVRVLDEHLRRYLT